MYKTNDRFSDEGELKLVNYPKELKLKKSVIMLSVFGVLSLNQPQAVHAQSGAATLLEEVIITARRYEESVEDAPVAVSVLTGNALKANRITLADDVFNYTPGATYESFSKVQPVASLRGIIAPTPGNSSSESSIQTVVDNVVVSKDFMKSQPLFDLNRVEVLRGPQGTAFGRNAAAGLIHFVTAKPSQESTGAVGLTVGTDERIELDGHFNGALNENWSGRLAFNVDSEGGQTESISTGEGLDGTSNTAIRGSLLYEPNDTFSAYLKLEHSVDRDDGPVRHGYFQDFRTDTDLPYVGGIDTGTGPYQVTFFDDPDPFKTEISSGTDFHLDRDVTTLAAELAWDVGDYTITSITGFMTGENDSLVDLIGSPNDVAFQQVRNDGDSISSELRIDNAGSDSNVRWLAGVYVLRDEEDRFEENQFQFNDARSFPFVPTGLATFSNNVTTSASIFGEVTFDLSEKARLTYGGRYVRDEKDYTYGVSAYGFNGQIAGVPGVPSDCGGPVCGSIDSPFGFSGAEVNDNWDDYISKLSFDYELSDTINAYALYSEGFKSGTFQPDARNIESVNIVVEPESSTNFEVGFKSATSKGRWAITLFRTELEDVQTINLVTVGDSFTGLISNVGEVNTTGIEAEGTFAIVDNFIVGGNFGLFDSELRDTLDPDGTIDPTTGEVLDLDGQRPAGAPEWTFTFFGDYTVPMASGSSVTLRADVRGRSDVFNQTSERDTNLRVRPEVINVGASIAWLNANENLSISLWAKNLNEDVDITNFGPPSPCCSSFATGFRNKRSIGVSANYNW